MSIQSSQMAHSAAGRNRESDDLDRRLAILFWPLLFILAGASGSFPKIESRTVPGSSGSVLSCSR